MRCEFEWLGVLFVVSKSTPKFVVSKSTPKYFTALVSWFFTSLYLHENGVRQKRLVPSLLSIKYNKTPFFTLSWRWFILFDAYIYLRLIFLLPKYLSAAWVFNILLQTKGRCTWRQAFIFSQNFSERVLPPFLRIWLHFCANLGWIWTVWGFNFCYYNIPKYFSARVMHYLLT